MRMPLRRYAISALVVGAVAGATAIALPQNGTPGWKPVSYGLTASPADLLPTHVSAVEPVRVVSTTVDGKGRPVVTTRTATDRESAAKLITDGQKAKNAVGVELDSVITISDVPTGADPYRSRQWDLSKMRVASAWPTSTGAGVTVAVLDSGVDATHPDLDRQVLTGYDVIAGSDRADSDPNGHGTHVAGTIAALTGNDTGISAIAPEAKILPVRVVGANGSGYMSDAADGILYAADHGAGVINMSLGSTAHVMAVSNAIGYARSKGVVVVAAAGNERAKGSPVSYPAADDGVIGVAATDSADHVAAFSNQGSYVDVAAPGDSILSTVPADNGLYAFYSGTSMASPHVAASAALIKAAYPALSPDQVQSALEKSAVDLGTEGKDTDYGYGRIDAAAALVAANPATARPATSAVATETTTPIPSATTPTPNATTPSASATAPSPNATTPSPNATPPGPEATTPSPNATPSGPEATTPSANATTPSPSATTPAKTTSPTPTPTRTPAKAPAKVTPTIKPTIKVTITAGTTSKVTYTVTANGKAWAHEPVQLGATAANGSTFTYTTLTTDAAGRVTFARKITARTRVKLTVRATTTSVQVTSPVTTLTPKKR
jgi:serine protease